MANVSDSMSQHTIPILFSPMGNWPHAHDQLQFQKSHASFPSSDAGILINVVNGPMSDHSTASGLPIITCRYCFKSIRFSTPGAYRMNVPERAVIYQSFYMLTFLPRTILETNTKFALRILCGIHYICRFTKIHRNWFLA